VQGNVAKSGEKVRVTVDLTALTITVHNPSAYAGEIQKNVQFVIVVKPPVRSVIDMTTVAPAEVTQVNDLG
jgi:hypothetical protein